MKSIDEIIAAIVITGTNLYSNLFHTQIYL